MRAEDSWDVYGAVSIVLAVILGIVTLVLMSMEDSDMCARDMMYYLTPYQRQVLLSSTSDPSFEALSNYCKTQEIEFSDILSAQKNLSLFDTQQ